MVEKEILRLFRTNFLEKKDGRRIVIYGTGEWARAILENCPEAPIFGLLDGYYHEGELIGRKIISLESLEGKPVKIVIVARKTSEILVYKRISGTCQAYQIPVYNLEGVRLDVPVQEASGAAEWDVESLYGELLSFEQISFDIFDTLLLRKTVFREKLYQMFGRTQGLDFDFCGVRLQAEKSLLEKGREPSLEAIYECVQGVTGISPELKEKLKAKELWLEFENLIPRKEIGRIYDRLAKCGKRIWLISDMYFSRKIVERILAKNGIENYEAILISCEYGVNKRNGLFREYLRQVPGGRKAHVGDSGEADGYCAKENGIVPFVIPSVMEAVTQKRAEKLLMNYESEQLEYARGLSFSHLLDSKKLKSPAVWFHTGHQLGFSLVGPVLYGWARWIYERCVDTGVEKVLFVSRDGYLVRKVFQSICRREKKEVETEYLTLSRSLGWRALVYSEEDLRELLRRPFAGSVSEWLNKRFGISSCDGRNFSGNEEAVLAYLEEIREQSEQTRTRYLEHWKTHVSERDRMAFVDFVSVGTCQKCLEKLTGLTFHGMYFEALPSSEGRTCADSYVHTLWERDIPAYHYLLWEFLVKEPGPSVKNLDRTGDFIYGENRLETDGIAFLEEVHRGVLEYADQYLDAMDFLPEKEDLGGLVRAMIGLLDDRYIKLEESMRKHLHGFDEFMNREMSF